MDVSGSAAVVTGGASGLGFATAQRLRAAGAQVVFIDLPSSPGDQAAAELGATFVAGEVAVRCPASALDRGSHRSHRAR
jgi:NAD(P)-dependent dehydrogenase (short-subunit alcohol dehydrogenase family)